MEFAVIVQPLGMNVPISEAAVIEVSGLPLPVTASFAGSSAPVTFDLPEGHILDVELRATFPGSTEAVTVKVRRAKRSNPCRFRNRARI